MLLVSLTTLLSVTVTVTVCYSYQCSNIHSASMSNELFTYNDTYGYKEASLQWGYTAFGSERIHPSVIIYPKCDDEIYRVLAFARLCDYKVVIRSGGHQYAALSSCNSQIHKCIQIDMKYYDDIAMVDAVAVTVESGVRLRAFIQYLDSNHYFLPCGVYPHIAIGGHILTGGQGYLSKSHGLLGDYVTSFDIILSNGTKLQDISSKNELYWAVLGGSPGGYGIITKYELDLTATSNAYYPSSTALIYVFEWNKRLMLRFALLFIAIHDDDGYMHNADIGTFFLSFSYNLDIKRYVITISWIEAQSNDEHYLSRLFLNQAKDLSIEAIMMKEIEAPISALLLLLMEIHQTQYNTMMPYIMRSHATKHNLDEEFIDLLIDRIEIVIVKYGTYSTSGMMLMFVLESYANGAMYTNDPWMHKTSYPLRDHFIAFTVVMFYNESIHKNTKRLTAKWLDDSMQILMLTKAFGYGIHDYRNIALTFGNLDIHDVCSYYYPNRTAFRKLQQIKLKYDPLDLFHTTFTVPLPLPVTAVTAPQREL